MTKSMRDFVLSLILLAYATVMIVFFQEDFRNSFPIVYTFIGLYFLYNSLSIYIRSLNDFPGSRKPFLYNYKSSSKHSLDRAQYKKDNKNALLIFLLYFPGITFLCLLLIEFFEYSYIYLFLLFLLVNVGDYVCVLFWCPFRKFFLKNKCCTTCRITNWDRLMKFWVLLFIPHIMSYLLFTLGLLIFLHWEYVLMKHPERFYASTNEQLRCYHCQTTVCKK